MPHRTSARSRATVLLVEDVQPYLDLQTTFLSRHDVRVLVAPQGAAVTELARRERPDVAVIDVVASDPVGLDVCRALKDDDVVGSIPVVLVLSRTMADRAREVRADGVVLKPIVQREFLEAIRRHVALPERRAVRHPVNLRFRYALGGETGQAFSRDLSPHGAFLKTDRPVPTGATIDVRFRLPGDEREIACGALVRSAGDGGATGPHAPGFGVEFQGMASADRERLEDFVDRHSGRSPLHR